MAMADDEQRKYNEDVEAEYEAGLRGGEISNRLLTGILAAVAAVVGLACLAVRTALTR